MFFVLSGFILAYVYDTDHFDLKRFFWNRVARIYPIYIVAAILATPWLWVEVSSYLQAEDVVVAVMAAATLVITGILMIQAWLPQTFAYWNNSASWSLSVEAFFYSSFPLLNRLFSKLGLLHSVIGILALSIISSMIALSAYVFPDSPDSFPLFYSLPAFRLPEFISGIITYSVAKQIKPKSGLIALFTHQLHKIRRAFV